MPMRVGQKMNTNRNLSRSRSTVGRLRSPAAAEPAMLDCNRGSFSRLAIGGANADGRLGGDKSLTVEVEVGRVTVSLGSTYEMLTALSLWVLIVGPSKGARLDMPVTVKSAV